MEQDIINWLLGGMGTLIGFLLNVVWQAVKDLQTADRNLADKVASIEVLVAGTYIKRDEFDRFLSRLFEKLDILENKIDHKEDRSH